MHTIDAFIAVVALNHIVVADMFEVAVVFRGLYNRTKHLTYDTHIQMEKS